MRSRVGRINTEAWSEKAAAATPASSFHVLRLGHLCRLIAAILFLMTLKHSNLLGATLVYNALLPIMVASLINISMRLTLKRRRYFLTLQVRLE